MSTKLVRWAGFFFSFENIILKKNHPASNKTQKSSFKELTHNGISRKGNGSWKNDCDKGPSTKRPLVFCIARREKNSDILDILLSVKNLETAKITNTLSLLANAALVIDEKEERIDESLSIRLPKFKQNLLPLKHVKEDVPFSRSRR